MKYVRHALAVATALAIGAVAPAGAAVDTPVLVIVDMDSAAPGYQSSITVSPCDSLVSGVSVHVVDPLGTRSFWWIGYAGGIDRGIAFGHVPDAANRGSVTAVHGAVGAPLNPGNTPWTTTFVDPAFAGPEVQYIEGGSPVAAVIAAESIAPIFTVDIEIDGARAGDTFDFHLADFVSVWLAGGPIRAGAFSTTGPEQTLDTGGDATPDGTVCLHGVDADAPVSVPPAAFAVDYVDGPGSAPAIIVVESSPEDVNGDGRVDVDDIVVVVLAWGDAGGPADVNGDGTVGIDDLVLVVLGFAPCPGGPGPA